MCYRFAIIFLSALPWLGPDAKERCCEQLPIGVQLVELDRGVGPREM